MTEREALLQKENETLKEQLAEVQRQLDLLVRHLFGRKSEQTKNAPHAAQLDLALETENAAVESVMAAAPPKAKGGSRKGRKVRSQLWPEHLPVETQKLIPLCVQAAPEEWRCIGEEVTERLERVPGRLIRQRLVRPSVWSSRMRRRCGCLRRRK